MRKHFVLSTRTLVSKREVTQSFGTDNTVYVPMAVMEEIEKKYWDQVNERGKIARETLTYLGSFHYDQLKKGVIQKNSSILIVPNNFYDIEINEKVLKSDLSKLDIRILQTCLGIQKQVPENEPVILVSKKASLRNHPYGVIPKNNGQKFMIEALMADFKEAPLVIFKGPAGTAKTFMSLAVGLELVQEKDKYPNKILISRSPTETGEKIGFLPGTEIDKISPYLRGIMDNITALNTKKDETTSEVSNFKKRKNNFGGSEKPEFDDGTFFFERNDIKAEAVGYIRGRSICDTYIIIDEAQNLSPVEIKTIITRVGTGTKLILLGDPAQIDRPELDERNNGLSYASERMKGEKTCWQITMTDDESVRSELAKRASMLL